jgi:hypothetical protein
MVAHAEALAQLTDAQLQAIPGNFTTTLYIHLTVA